MDRQSLSPPRGMRDFYPEDCLARNRIFQAWTEAARSFGFVPYDACVVESLDLLKRKAGEEIADQIYAFQDRSGNELALRPEMTPTLARMVVARHGAMSFPIKWFAIAQCFRYERAQKGRKREHYQWNLDVLGEPSIAAEADVIACAVQAFRSLGLTENDVRIHISSRALLADLLAVLKVPADVHPAVFLALDKRGKIPDDAVAAILLNAGVPPSSVAPILASLAIPSLDAARERLPPDSRSLLDLETLFALLDSHGVAGFAQFDISVIRGLGYYTGIVFEAFNANKSSRAILGGGRYDDLLANLGGRPTCGVGLGFGDVVIADILAERGIPPPPLQQDAVAVGYIEPAQQPVAIRLGARLRSSGRRVDVALAPEKARQFFSRASRDGFADAVLIGPDDVQRGAANLKNLATRAASPIPLLSCASP